MKRLILIACLMAFTAATADAGPLRNFAQRIRGGCGCGVVSTSQPTAAPVQDQATPPTVVMPQSGTVHRVSYVRSDAGPVVGVGYDGIRLTSPMPTTCVGGVCGR